jgi:hypothetical protein
MGVTDELEEFKRALARYGHLVRVRELDPERAQAIEEIQLRIVREVLAALRARPAPSLEDLLQRLMESGDLSRYVRLVAEVVGEEVEDPEGAIGAAINGQDGVPGPPPGGPGNRF